MDRLQAAIEDLIARSGPIGFDEYMAQALYACPGSASRSLGGGGRPASGLPDQPRGRAAVRGGGGPCPGRLVG